MEHKNVSNTSQLPLTSVRGEHSHMTPAYAFAATVAAWSAIAYLCVLYVIWRKCAHRNYIMVSQYLLITSLSMSDLLLAETLLPVYVITHRAYEDDPWHMVAMEYIQVSCLITSLFSIIALTLNKYIFCKFSLKYQRIVTRKRTITAIIAIWLASLTTTALAIFPPIGSPKHSYIYPEILLASICVIGGIVVVFIHVHLHLISRRMLATEQRHIENVGSREIMSAFLKRRLKATIVVNVITALFMLFYIPHASVLFYIHISSQCDWSCEQALEATQYILYLSTMLNPIIFGLTIRDVRDAFRAESRRVFGFFRNRSVAISSANTAQQPKISFNSTVTPRELFQVQLQTLSI